MKVHALLLAVFTTTLIADGIDPNLPVQEARVELRFDVGPYYPYYGPYDPYYGPCPGYDGPGIYIGPGCPRYYYGPYYDHRHRHRRHRRHR